MKADRVNPGAQRSARPWSLDIFGRFRSHSQREWNPCFDSVPTGRRTFRACHLSLVRKIDYDPLPFTQGRITAFGLEKKFHDIDLFDGYPRAETARNFKYEIFRPDTRTLRCSDRNVQTVKALDSLHLRVFTPDENADSPEQVGDLIVIGSEEAPHGSIPHAVECDHNVHVRLEDIDLFTSNCFGFIESDCDGSVYYRCRIDRRSAASDFVKRGDPRALPGRGRLSQH